MVDEFVENFNNMDTSNYIRNVIHNKSWKENEVELLKMTEWILGVFMACSMQSGGTYITDAIMPLLHASLGDLPNGYICLSSAERQSLASKVRRNDGTDKEKMGKKPNIMALEKCNGKLLEFLYVE
ncbi:12973_t:CDS:2, partial [Entrophospora sp. SA101]